MAITPLMNLNLPTATVTPGPNWATALNEALSVVDSHDHSSGNGARITPTGLNINSDLEFNSNNATELRSVRLLQNVSALANAADLAAVYSVAGELFYNDGLGNQIQITASGGLNAASIGGIGGDYGSSTALLSYSSASQIFFFEQNTDTPAAINAGSVAVREPVLNSRAITLASPTALANSYNFTFPTALPASNLPLSISAAGQVSAEQLEAAQISEDAKRNIVPAGSVIASFAISTPTGYLYCDGSAVSRTTFAELFAAIGTSCGEGDGSTTFNLPDLRGEFLRGQDDGRGRDPDAASRTAQSTGGNTGDAVGTAQNDEFGSHNHGGGNHNHSLPRSAFPWAAAGGSFTNLSVLDPINDASSGFSGTIIATEGGNETRSKNIAVRYYIKA